MSRLKLIREKRKVNLDHEDFDLRGMDDLIREIPPAYELWSHHKCQENVLDDFNLECSEQLHMYLYTTHEKLPISGLSLFLAMIHVAAKDENSRFDLRLNNRPYNDLYRMIHGDENKSEKNIFFPSEAQCRVHKTIFQLLRKAGIDNHFGHTSDHVLLGHEDIIAWRSKILSKNKKLGEKEYAS